MTSFKNIFLGLSLSATLFSWTLSEGNFVIFDVSMESSFQDCHIKGAQYVAYDKIAKMVRDFEKSTDIVVYCTNAYCTASTEAYHILKKLGFTNVSIYKGGIAQWYQEGLPTEGGCKQPYLLQKVEKKEVDSLLNVISTQELKSKLETCNYDPVIITSKESLGWWQTMSSSFYGAADSIKNFFINFFRLK